MAATPNSRSTTDVDLHLARQVERRRRAAGITQAQLAKACGVSFQQVQKYEEATNRVAASRLFSIAQAIGCPVGDLYPGAEAA